MLQPLSYHPGDRIGGRFQVHEALAGGMGEVYLCLDLEQNLPYALKTFQRQYATAELREAFFEEVATWVALERHPNIVRCFFLSTLDNRPFMFLEWIPRDEKRGNNLRGWLQHGPLALQLALDFTIDICRGLIHAGEKVPGIVHRDLKPENVLIDPNRQAKITDFGLATAAQKAKLQLEAMENTTDRWHSLHGARGVVGTPPYMPPEQWHGGEIDARADIYAVGCMLYELVTGQPPFSANSLRGFYEQHCRAPIPYLSEHPLLTPILMHCLAKRPDGRFNTVNDLLTELERVYLQQFGQPVKVPLPETQFTALDHHNRGVTYRDLGQHARAVEDFSMAIDLYPAFAEAYLLRGFCYAELNQMAHADADIRRAFELGPVGSSWSDMYYNRGTFWMEQGHLDNAVADFTRAIDLDPTDARSYNNRGLCYCHRQLFIEAIIDFSRALELKPDHAKAYGQGD